MKSYSFITTGLLLCTAIYTLECCKLRRSNGLTDETPKPITVVGTMGNAVKLPGHLISPTQPFYKDGKVLHASEHLYELRKSPAGYQVVVRFLTCTDEGTYSLGSKTFHLIATAQHTCGMFYYAAKVDEVTKAAIVSPLDGVFRISKLCVQPKNDLMWSLTEVWNRNMSRTLSPGHCCFMFRNGTTFGGYGDKQCNYFMYQRRGQADDSCSNVQLTAFTGSRTLTTGRNPILVKPSLEKLGDVKTTVKLYNVSDSITELKKQIKEFESSWKKNSAASNFQTPGLVTPIILSVLPMMMMMVANTM